MTKSILAPFACISLLSSQPFHPNAGKTIATYQIGSSDAQLEQGLGVDGKDMVLQVQFYGKNPSIPNAEKLCREYLAKAIKQFGSKDIIVFAWFGSHKGISKNDFDEIALYKSLGFKKKEPGKFVGYKHLIYKDGIVKVD